MWAGSFPGASSTTQSKWNLVHLPSAFAECVLLSAGTRGCTDTDVRVHPQNKHKGSYQHSYIGVSPVTHTHTCTNTSVLRNARELRRRRWAQWVHKCPLETLQSKPAQPGSWHCKPLKNKPHLAQRINWAHLIHCFNYYVVQSVDGRLKLHLHECKISSMSISFRGHCDLGALVK